MIIFQVSSLAILPPCLICAENTCILLGVRKYTLSVYQTATLEHLIYKSADGVHLFGKSSKPMIINQTNNWSDSCKTYLPFTILDTWVTVAHFILVRFIVLKYMMH